MFFHHVVTACMAKAPVMLKDMQHLAMTAVAARKERLDDLSSQWRPGGH